MNPSTISQNKKFSAKHVGAALFLLLMSTGCFAKHPTFHSTRNLSLNSELHPGLVHTIRYPGETLSAISLWYTGSVDNWKRLQELNPALSPSSMKVGDSVFVPENLISRRTNPPKKVLVHLDTSENPNVIVEDRNVQIEDEAVPTPLNSPASLPHPTQAAPPDQQGPTDNLNKKRELSQEFATSTPTPKDDLFRELRLP